MPASKGRSFSSVYLPMRILVLHIGGSISVGEVRRLGISLVERNQETSRVTVPWG